MAKKQLLTFWYGSYYWFMFLIHKVVMISHFIDKVVQRQKLCLCKPHACEHVASVLLPHGCLLLTLHSGRVSCYVWLVLQKHWFWFFSSSQLRTLSTEDWSKSVFGLLSAWWPWKCPGGWFSCVLCCITPALAPAAGPTCSLLGLGSCLRRTEYFFIKNLHLIFGLSSYYK